MYPKFVTRKIHVLYEGFLCCDGRLEMFFCCAGVLLMADGCLMSPINRPPDDESISLILKVVNQTILCRYNIFGLYSPRVCCITFICIDVATDLMSTKCLFHTSNLLKFHGSLMFPPHVKSNLLRLAAAQKVSKLQYWEGFIVGTESWTPILSVLWGTVYQTKRVMNWL